MIVYLTSQIFKNFLYFWKSEFSCWAENKINIWIFPSLLNMEAHSYSLVLELHVLSSLWPKDSQCHKKKKQGITKWRVLSSSLKKYSFSLSSKDFHLKSLQRTLLENSFQLVKLKNWKNSKERIISGHLSFDFHLDAFPFAPRTCLTILFLWDAKRSVDSHVWLC